MKIADRVGGFILLAFAGYIMITALSMQYAISGVPGPGFLPFWAGLILAVSAVLILVKSWKKPLAGLLMESRAILWRTLIFGLGMAAMIFVLPHLGMVVTLALFMLLAVPFLGAREKVKIAMAVVLVPLFVFVLFQYVLQVPLPAGPWRF
ncbi:MAG: tripartite tricarboxylate transporter TctB family protein [Deltaproteobacteria bacterium]|nr:tripartite tricarboxylate transporter TctB family protein [Deltaproteobacteria bacterium]